MLLHNNSDLDAQALADKLQDVAANRRRSQPLLAGKPAGTESTNAFPLFAKQDATGGWRAIVKRVPVFGPLAVAAYRRVRHLAMPGLSLKQRIRMFPFIGSALAWAYSIFRLNRIRHQITQEIIALQQLNTGAAVRMAQIEERLRFLNDTRLPQLEANDAANRGRIGLAESRLESAETRIEMAEHSAAKTENRIDHMNESLEQLASALSEAQHALAGLNALDLENVLRLQENRIAGLTQELRHAIAVSQPAAVPAQVQARQAPGASSFDEDSFYVEFEGLFRGTREEIRSRQGVYLPYLAHIAHIAGDSAARVVDVGCGRGEWLELLRDEGIDAVGIDMNAAMVNDCRARGLAAECMDAISYLRQQPEGSLAAVTGFHIIEHLPFAVLIDLFDAALRALRSDGLIIFETPNPENLTVGACNFYYDPTHVHPIAPVVAQFIAKQRGFARAEILRLHPYPEYLRVNEDSEAARHINQALYGPQDFAVLAWKTHAN